jgi:hypothetical protein
MALDGDVVQELNAGTYAIPMYAIVGDTGRHAELYDVGGDFTIANYTHEDLFRFGGEAENSDGLVGLSSAGWAGSGIASEVMLGKRHTSMGKDEEISARVVQLLAGPVSAFGIPSETLSAESVKPAKFTKSAQYPGSEQDGYPTKITFFADKAEARPGETFNAWAAIEGHLEDAVFVFYTGDGDVVRNADELSWTVTIPPDFSGFCGFGASGFVDGEVSISNAAMVFVKPDLTRATEMSFAQGAEASCFEGAEIPLQLKARLDDGREFDISRSEFGTAYTSSNPLAAAISENGLLEAVAPGRSTITAKNGALETSIEVTVEPFDVRLATRPADASGGGCDTGSASLALLALAGAAVLLRAKLFKAKPFKKGGISI